MNLGTKKDWPLSLSIAPLIVLVMDTAIATWTALDWISGRSDNGSLTLILMSNIWIILLLLLPSGK